MEASHHPSGSDSVGALMDDFVGFVVDLPSNDRQGFITLGRIQDVVDAAPLSAYFRNFLAESHLTDAAFRFEDELGDVMLGERFFEGFELLRSIWVADWTEGWVDEQQRSGRLFIDVGRLRTDLFLPPPRRL